MTGKLPENAIRKLIAVLAMGIGVPLAFAGGHPAGVPLFIVGLMMWIAQGPGLPAGGTEQ